MIYDGRALQVAPGIFVGFSEQGEPFHRAGTPEEPADPRMVLAAASEMREAMLRQVAFITAWIEAAVAPPKSSIIVAPAGAVPVNGSGPRRVR